MKEQEEDNDYVLAFDHFYTTNHIQILKALLPYAGEKLPKIFPVLIKYMELKYTISMVKEDSALHMTGINACSQESPQLEKIFQSIRRYLSPEEEKGFQQIVQMMQTMENMKEMQQMMEMFQGMNMDTSAFTGNTDEKATSDFEGFMNQNMNLQEMMQFIKDMT